MKIIFAHGYTANTTTDWYPQITAELRRLKIAYAIPNLPGEEHPHSAEWIELLHAEIEKAKEPPILVGHSLGTRAALLTLEKYPTKLKALILVATFANKLENAKRRDEAYADFFDHLIDLEKIKETTPTRVILHSMDDDSIPYRQGQEMTRDLGAHLLTYNGKGHFDQPENYIYILDVIKNILNIK
ncbi:alpha/beta fold hydrolase [Candidatus Woesebacteria bacterium]|jgi:predicted alpha/beta hydrolase family esterase|nr:alpha/beta fold hydrolase [Candidatus Woesebacteria bacterium]